MKLSIVAITLTIILAFGFNLAFAASKEEGVEAKITDILLDFNTQDIDIENEIEVKEIEISEALETLKRGPAEEAALDAKESSLDVRLIRKRKAAIY